MPSLACAETLGDAGSGQPRDDVARADGDLFLGRPNAHHLRRRDEDERPRALEHDVDLLILGMAVDGPLGLVRRPPPVQTSPLRACGGPRRPPVPLDVGDVDDVGGPWAGLGKLEISRVGLEVPRVTILGDLHRRVHAKNARTREVGRGGVRPLAEGKDVESARPRDQRGPPRRRGGRSCRPRAPRTSCRPATRGPSRRARRRSSSSSSTCTGDERPSGSIFSRATPTSFDRGVAEVDAVELHRAAAKVARFDVVPVRDAHQTSSKWMSCAPSQSTRRPISSRCSRLADDGCEMVPSQLAGLAREAGLAVREEDLRLAHAAGVEQQLSGSG